MNAVIISVGSELTLGQTVDTNAAWLSRKLAEVGIPANLHITVSDDLEPMVAEIARACTLADLVIITGGIGPTDDDLTRQALARVMGVELRLNEDQLEPIRCFFAKRGKKLTPTNERQACFPEGSTPIENTCGTAPGIRANVSDAIVFVMPGVPREMRVMYERDVLPHIAASGTSGVILSTTLWCYGAGESEIARQISDLMTRGNNPAVGTTAQQGIIGIRINAHGTGIEEAQKLLSRTADDVRNRFSRLIYGQDDETLWSVIAETLSDTKTTISTAESCTGGLIAKWLTDIAGSSAYFIQGHVTYANDAKTRLLDVPAEMLATHGAVSPEVAETMATNCRHKSQTDYAISVTGIAGPGGGTDAKPVGLVYIGIATPDGCDVHEHRFGDQLNRAEIRDRTAKAALNHLRLKLKERCPAT